MGKTVIIRGLWGDASMRKQNREFSHRFEQSTESPHDALLASVRAAVESGQPVDYTFACGDANGSFLQSLGLPCQVVTREPWASPRLHAEQYHEDRHWSLVWGFSTWWHKLRLIEAALMHFDAVLWVDWRVKLAAPERLRQWLGEASRGHWFRGCLIRQRSTGWAARWRYTTAKPLPGVAQMEPQTEGRIQLPHAHDLVGGGLIYFRGAQGLNLVRRSLGLNESHPYWTDQMLLAAACDIEYGRWIGPRHWRAVHELPGYYYPRNRWYTEPQDTVWECGDRMPKVEYRRLLWK